MSRNGLRSALIGIGLAIAAVGAYWYWSPVLDMRSMKASAEKKDADAFNQYVDYPKLRESLKGQFNAKMAGMLGRSSGGGDMERAGSAIGAMLGLALADKMIDAMVRPEMVMRAMSDAKLQSPMGPGSKEADAGGAKREVKWTLERKGLNRVIAYGADREQAMGDGRFGFVFDRTGFAAWKLTEIRLPTKE